MEFARLLRNQQYINLEFKEYNWFKSLANQTHVDFILENREFKLSLDDLSERILHPCARALADKIKDAKYCYHLELPKNYECCRYLFDSVSVRGIINREHEIWQDDGSRSITNLIRFDILWSK